MEPSWSRCVTILIHLLILPSLQAFSLPKGPLIKDIVSNRRDAFKIVTGVSSAFVIPGTESSNYKANALPFGSNEERRQLELCLVTILRVRYWCETVALSIQEKIDNAPPTGLTDVMKAPYLEARLGAKAVLTGKKGGGANARVYNLATLQLRECVKDAESWFNESYKLELKKASGQEKTKLKIQKELVDNASVNIIESLANLVEFDGLDNVKDPSPRSTLALAQYNDSKAKYIKRILIERTVPACETLINGFGGGTRRLVENYVAQTYSNDLPQSVISRRVQLGLS